MPISFKVASLALELLCKWYSEGALMADDMGKIDKSELCVNSSGYAAHDGVVYIVGVLAQFLWEAQAHKVSGR